MGVKETFDRVAEEYDRDRRILIPCFDDFYGMVVSLLQQLGKQSAKILDLGIGTGLLSALVLEEFPQAKITGMDLSGKMLVEAEKRFQGRVELIEADYITGEAGTGFDAVISSLSIHHLDSAQKVALFCKVQKILNPGGIFINADQVTGSSAVIEEVYRNIWYKQIRELGISAELLAAAEERMKEDKMSTLAEQLDWLSEAGFQEVNCWYQNYLFVVYAGVKP